MGYNKWQSEGFKFLVGTLGTLFIIGTVMVLIVYKEATEYTKRVETLVKSKDAVALCQQIADVNDDTVCAVVAENEGD